MQADLDQEREKLVHRFNSEMTAELERQERRKSQHREELEAEFESFKAQLAREIETRKTEVEKELRDEFAREIAKLREEQLRQRLKEEERAKKQVHLEDLEEMTRSPRTRVVPESVKTEFRAELERNIDQVREKLRDDFAKEIKELEKEIRMLRGRTSEVRIEVESPHPSDDEACESPVEEISELPKIKKNAKSNNTCFIVEMFWHYLSFFF